MTPLPAKAVRPNGSTLPWGQTSFWATAPESTPSDDPSWETVEALRAADHAVDLHSQRIALDRLTASLTWQARQRGRTPIPKRSESQK